MKLAACLLALSIVSGVPEAVTLRVTPQQTFELATIRSTIQIEPNYLNVAVCLLWDSEDGESGKHCWTIEGQYAPKTYTFDVVRLPAGSYTFQASVAQGPKWIMSASQQVHVISRVGE